MNCKARGISCPMGWGSALGLTDSSGRLQTQYTYEPFRNTSVSGSTNASSYQFTGRENDGTGLYFYRARYYNPTLLRFVSEDPIGFPGGINLYRYVYDSPVIFADPFGLWTVQVGAGVGGNIPVGGAFGFAFSAYGGLAYDGSHWGFYYGGGLGFGLGAGAAGGVTLGGSNAQTICGLRGPFLNVGGSGGAGWGGGASGFAGQDSHGNTVLGGDVMVGGAGGASGSAQGTYTRVHPLGGRYTCPQ